jgi:hypothetical protein
VTQRSRTFVPKASRLTKPELHAKVMRGWSRAIDRLGKGAFADALEISGAGLDKQLAGSLPGFDLIDRAFDCEPSVLDDWADTKGLRLVPKDAVCDTDDVSILVSRLLNKLIEAQHPDSPGGRRIVPPEVFGMEELLREVIRVAGSLLDQAETYRGGNVTSMRGSL